MRPDLDKCTTECYRRGAGSFEHIYKIKFGGKVGIHTDPDHEYENERGGFHSSARHRHKECKDFGDKLGALRGNLRANVGRRWDDIFSEFCKYLDRRSINGHHIWTHLQFEVTINTYMGDDGIIYERGKYGNTMRAYGYYVHPLTGILEYVPPRYSWKRRWKDRKPALDKLEIPVPGEVDWKYCLIDGLWFQRRMVKVNKFIGTSYSYIEHQIEKKSANKKEIAWIKAQLVRWGY